MKKKEEEEEEEEKLIHPSLFFVKIVEIVSLGESGSTTTLNTSTPSLRQLLPFAVAK